MQIHKASEAKSLTYSSDHQTEGQRRAGALKRIALWHATMPAVLPTIEIVR